MMPPQQKYHSQKPEKNHEGLNQLRKDGGGTTPMVFVAKQCCTHQCASTLSWWINQSRFHYHSGLFSADFLPQTLQNFPLLTMVSCLGNMHFPPRGLLFCFWVKTVNPHFILCIFDAISWSMKQNLRQMYHSLNQALQNDVSHSMHTAINNHRSVIQRT